MPAQCATASQPLKLSINRETSDNPQEIDLTPSFDWCLRSIETISCPSLASRFIRWLPMNPVPPVIAILIFHLFQPRRRSLERHRVTLQRVAVPAFLQVA